MISLLAFRTASSTDILACLVPRFTNQLERLEIIPSDFVTPIQYSDFMGRFQAELLACFGLAPVPEAPFPFLRDVCIPLWGEHHKADDWKRMKCLPEHFADYIRAISGVFGPEVEVLSGCFPPMEGLKPEEFGESLSVFPNLKRIVICDIAVGGFGAAEEYIIAVASTCASLQFVEVKGSLDRVSWGLRLEISREVEPSFMPRIVQRTWRK